MTSADDVQTAIWSLSLTWMSVWRSILNDLGPVSFCGPYWITSSFPVCKLMCFFPPIHNPPHAAIPSAPDLAEPALTPGDLYSSWEEPDNFSLLTFDLRALWGLLWKPQLPSLMACIQNIKSTMRFLVHSQTVSTVSQGPNFLLQSCCTPAEVLWVLCFKLLELKETGSWVFLVLLSIYLKDLGLFRNLVPQSSNLSMLPMNLCWVIHFNQHLILPSIICWWGCFSWWSSLLLNERSLNAILKRYTITCRGSYLQGSVQICLMSN